MTTALGKVSLLRDLRLLEAVHQAGSVTRQQLGESLGLNRTTVARIVADLLERNLLTVEAVSGAKKPGRPSELLKINPGAGYSIGLEFGRQELVVVITDAVGQVLLTKEPSRIPKFVGSDQTMDELAAVIRSVAKEAGVPWESVRSVGLALHDVVTATGGWRTHEKLNEPPYEVEQYLKGKLERFVVVEDVSRSFAESEHRFGAGREAADMTYVFLGSHGVGGGIFVNNRLLKSSSGVCGEIGHIVVDESGPICRCGNSGCFEVFAAHDAILEQLASLVAQGVITSLSEETKPKFADLCQAAGEGDKGAYLVLHRLASYMGKALATVINICGTPLIVVGGHIHLAGEVFRADLAAVVRQHCITTLAQQVCVRYTEAPPHAGAWGVAIQAVEGAWTKGEFFVRS